MSELEQNGLKILYTYNQLKRSLYKTNVLLIALRNSGGPKIVTEHPAVRENGGTGYINTDLLLKEFFRIAEKRTRILSRLCCITDKVDQLPENLQKLIRWRYMIFAKREAIAKRLHISIRHYSRIRRQALEALGKSYGEDEELRKIVDNKP